MNKRMQFLSMAATAAVLFAVISWGGVAQAQQSSPNSDTPSQTAPPPAQQPDAGAQGQSPSQPAQPPDTQAPATRQGQQDPGQTPDKTTPPSGQTPDQAQSDTSGAKEFVGTVVKQGNKYMFQDSATGQTYDIDHQDDVKKFDGKRIRMRGTLDPQTNTIHVQ